MERMRRESGIAEETGDGSGAEGFIQGELRQRFSGVPEGQRRWGDGMENQQNRPTTSLLKLLSPLILQIDRSSTIKVFCPIEFSTFDGGLFVGIGKAKP